MQARWPRAAPSAVNSMKAVLRVADAARLQAGQAVGDDLRQHGHHAVGQVDAGGPVAGLAVQRPSWAGRSATRRRCGRPAASARSVELLQRDGVVEVAGVDRVDGDDRLGRSGRARPAGIDSSNASAWRRASSRASSANSSGRSNSRMIDSVSTPGLPRGPSTSVITPSPSWHVRRKADHLEDDLVVGAGRSWRPGSPTRDRAGRTACRRPGRRPRRADSK